MRTNSGYKLILLGAFVSLLASTLWAQTAFVSADSIQNYRNNNYNHQQDRYEYLQNEALTKKLARAQGLFNKITAMGFAPQGHIVKVSENYFYAPHPNFQKMHYLTLSKEIKVFPFAGFSASLIHDPNSTAPAVKLNDLLNTAPKLGDAITVVARKANGELVQLPGIFNGQRVRLFDQPFFEFFKDLKGPELATFRSIKNIVLLGWDESWHQKLLPWADEILFRIGYGHLHGSPVFDRYNQLIGVVRGVTYKTCRYVDPLEPPTPAIDFSCVSELKLTSVAAIQLLLDRQQSRLLSSD